MAFGSAGMTREFMCVATNFQVRVLLETSVDLFFRGPTARIACLMGAFAECNSPLSNSPSGDYDAANLHGIAMNDSNNFAPVPTPGAKRILSGKVADIPAPANNKLPDKRVLRVLTCSGDKDFSELLQEAIQTHLGNGCVVEVTDRWKATEILELLKQRSFDIIIPLVNNIITPTHTGEDRIRNTVELLAKLKVQYGMPIIALSGFKPSFDLPELLKQAGVDAFFWMPFDNGEFLSAVQRCLKIPLAHP